MADGVGGGLHGGAHAGSFGDEVGHLGEEIGAVGLLLRGEAGDVEFGEEDGGGGLVSGGRGVLQEELRT